KRAARPRLASPPGAARRPRTAFRPPHPDGTGQRRGSSPSARFNPNSGTFLNFFRAASRLLAEGGRDCRHRPFSRTDLPEAIAMITVLDLAGYFASTMVLLTFLTKDMRLLRILAIFSNIGFVTYGLLAWLPPVFCLHLLLLPVNALRL